MAGRVLHTPGHTPGSASLFLDSGEAIIGDMAMNFGRSNKPGKPILAWDLERNRASIRRIIDLAPRTIYATHGGPYEDLSGLLEPS